MTKRKEILSETEPSEEPGNPADTGAPEDKSRIISSNPNSDPAGGPEHTFNLLPHEPPVNSKRIDLAELRVTQDFDLMDLVTKRITLVPVCRPSKQTFFRIHPDENWKLQTFVLEFEEHQETYIVTRKVVAYVSQVAVLKVIYAGITRSGDLFLCPVGLPDANGKWNSWTKSLRAAMEIAKHKWVKIVSNRGAGKYETFEAEGDIPEPEWPDDVTFEDLIDIAFEDRIIDTPDHPVLLKLRGKI
jgi:hypothetical protein